MDKGRACFRCRHGGRQLGEHRSHGSTSIFNCALGIDNSMMNGGIEQVLACPKGDPRVGFQIGGYYTHMWFEYDGTPPAEGGNPNSCLEWMIASDGEFTTEDDKPGIEFHICDFTQIERWVAFWGEELRRRGWITEDDADA